jgi:DNA-binding beta-propeller fold protein YncE
LALYFIWPAFSQAGELGFQAESFELKVKDGMYIEEVPGLGISPDGRRIYIFNRGQHALLVFRRNGGFEREIGAGLFSVPHGLRVDADGNIWTTDIGNHLVIKFSPEGRVLMVLGKKGTASPGWFDRDYNQVFLNKPSDVAFDDEGNVYVADGGNFRVVKYSTGGEVLRIFGEKGTGPGQFNFPHSLIVDSKGRLLVASIVGSLFFQEVVDIWVVAGSMLILGSSVYGTWKEQKSVPARLSN